MSSRQKRRRIWGQTNRRARAGGVPWSVFILLLLLALVVSVARVAR